jgi:hypothetical protein
MNIKIKKRGSLASLLNVINCGSVSATREKQGRKMKNGQSNSSKFGGQHESPLYCKLYLSGNGAGNIRCQSEQWIGI